MTSRRVVAGASILGVLLISSAVSGTLAASERASSATDALNLLRIPLYVRDLVFMGHIGRRFRLSQMGAGGLLAVVVYIAVVAICVATLLWRYRWAEV